jgi:hypothetical protein
MVGLATSDFFSAEPPVAEEPETINIVLEEICVAVEFGPDSHQRKEVSNFLAKLYCQGYCTVEGLRQAFIAYVEREISGSNRSRA